MCVYGVRVRIYNFMNGNRAEGDQSCSANTYDCITTIHPPFIKLPVSSRCRTPASRALLHSCSSHQAGSLCVGGGRSYPLWQADSSRPDVEPGPAEQIKLTQLNGARPWERLSWAGCSLALSLFLFACHAPLRTTPELGIRENGNEKNQKKNRSPPALHQLNWTSAAAQQ